jgi:hypothetical protein
MFPVLEFIQRETSMGFDRDRYHLSPVLAKAIIAS